MKPSAALSAAFKKSLDHVLDIFDNVDGQFTKKDFHALRVEIKRIKAIAALVEKIRKPFHRRSLLKPFEKIFEQAARIREPQVQQEMLHPYRQTVILKKLDTDMEEQVYVEQKKFSRLLKPSLKKQLKKNGEDILSHIRKLSVTAIEKILSRKQDNIDDTLSMKTLHPRDVHALRKRLKKIYYLRKILHPRSLKFAITDQFQELLGKWHDGTVLMLGLKKHKYAHPWTPRERTTLDNFINKIKAHNDKLLVSIQSRKNVFQ